MIRWFIFRYFRHDGQAGGDCRSFDLLSGFDSSRPVSNFLDTAEPPLCGDLPGSRENPSSLTARNAALRPIPLVVPGAPPTKILPDHTTGANGCRNTSDSRGNKRNHPAQQTRRPPALSAPHTLRRAAHPRNPRIRSALPGRLQPLRVRLCQR